MCKKLSVTGLKRRNLMTMGRINTFIKTILMKKKRILKPPGRNHNDMIINMIIYFVLKFNYYN